MVLTAPDSVQMVFDRVQRSMQSTTSAGFCKLSFRAMGTVCQVQFAAPNATVARDFQAEVLQWVAQFEAQYSRFIPDSLISRINAAAGEHWVEVDSETDALFNLCQEMIFFTRGVFDPTALPLIQLWNWKANPPVIPSHADIQAAQELVGWRKIERRPGGIFLPRAGMALDLGGIGKEYAVDRVLMMALQRGIQNVLVDFGQDVRVHGQPADKSAWYIGLEDPNRPGHCWNSVAVTNHAVATSGDYLRQFTYQGRRYGHILDPRTGYPVHNRMLSVSVVAPHCTFAGIISTAAFVLGPVDGMELMNLCPGVDGAIITETARLQTKGLYKYANP